IPRSEDRVTVSVIDHEREHAAQLARCCRTEAVVRRDDRLRVTGGVELEIIVVTQFVANFPEVIDLTIEIDRVTFRGFRGAPGQWLPGVGHIDAREAVESEDDPAPDPGAAFVGTAVALTVCCRAHSVTGLCGRVPARSDA